MQPNLPTMAKIVAALLMLSAAYLLTPASAGNVVCYFTSWTIYRPYPGNFTALTSDPSLCTHILYAFVGLSWDNKVAILDSWEFADDGLDECNHLLSLRDQNPDLKILVSMGGWNEGSTKYSDMAKNPSSRQTFVQAVVEFVEQYGFDGFDLDWEYPGQRSGDPDVDPANFVALLGELKAALNPKGYILSAAVSGGVASIDISYDVPAVSQNLDMINVMAYDFHGAFEPFVGHYAPLYASHLDVTPEQQTLNVATGIQHWIDKGADPSKINLGLGTYGRCFTLADPNNSSLYAGTYSGCEAGPYTRESGTLGYNEVCSLLSDWEYVWDDEQQVPHRVGKGQWVGFDDEKSLELKVEFAKSKSLGGLMIWSLDTDDFRGLCGNGPYPLLHAINNAAKKVNL